MKRVLVVGAGFSGAIIARLLAEAGIAVHVVDTRNHLGGNCFTATDAETGVMVHHYGAHIFHTDSDETWRFVCKFADMKPYVLRVKATTGNKVYGLPINLHTINQFYGQTFSPTEAQHFIAEKATKFAYDPLTFEEQALRFVGPDLYEAFFKAYPIKQWGLHPRELPASVLQRLPLRFNYDDNYFNHKYQGIPASGYTNIFEKLLHHENIEVELGRRFSKAMAQGYEHVFYSGPLDGWFNYQAGRLGYRTLNFESSYHEGDYQGCAVMSYPEQKVPFTRIIEHKHFTPWNQFEKTVVFREYSRQASAQDEPYYPIRLAVEQDMLKVYASMAEQETGVTFVGRLGTYRYLDMDVTIREAMAAARGYLHALSTGETIPAFFATPVATAPSKPQPVYTSKAA